MSEIVPDMSKRNHALDAWRGGLLMIVQWYHAGPMPEVERARIGALALLHDAVRQVGWATMDCFFAMSGFLVGGLLFAAYKKHGSLGIGRFYVRRGLKIYPVFYVMWVLTIVFGERIGVRVTTERAVVEGLFVQNFWRGLWVHTWSLGVEEQFYILLPLVLWVVGRKCGGRRTEGGVGGPNGEPATECRGTRSGAAGDRRGIRDPFAMLPWAYVVTLVGVMAARVWTAVSVPGWDMYRHFAPSYLRMDEPMIGVVCAWWYHFHRESLRRWVRGRWWVFAAVGAAGMAAPWVWAIESRWTLIAGYSLVAIGFSAVMLLIVEGPWRKAEERTLLRTVGVHGEDPPRSVGVPGVGVPGGAPWWWVRGLAFVGIHSYSIYVFHQPVRWAGGAVIRWGLEREATWWEYAALVFPVAVVVGIVIARVVEMPVLAWRNRVAPSKSGGVLGSGEPLSSHRPTARD